MYTYHLQILKLASLKLIQTLQSIEEKFFMKISYKAISEASNGGWDVISSFGQGAELYMTVLGTKEGHKVSA